MEVLNVAEQASSWKHVAVLIATGGVGFVFLSLRELDKGRAQAAARAACGVACFAAALVVGAYGVGSWTWLWEVAGVAAAVAAGWILARYAEQLLPDTGTPAASQLGPPPPAEPWQNVPRL